MIDEREELREELRDFEARHDYAEMFLDSSIALQIKSLRLQREWKQKDLARRAGLHQSQISDMEQITHSGWTIETLKKLARAFDLTLRVRFESFGSFLDEYAEQSQEGFERPSFDTDPAFASSGSGCVEDDAGNVIYLQPRRPSIKTDSQAATQVKVRYG